MLEVEQLASAQPESAVGAVEEIRRPPSVVQVDQDKQSDDFVMTTPNDVTHDVISLDGSDTDDAPEVISDSLTSRDHREAANQHHDHQHLPVSRQAFNVFHFMSELCLN